jgi:peptide/nickel transport system substrate-binding protein
MGLTSGAKAGLYSLLLVSLLAGCAGPADGTRGGAIGQAPATAKKRVVVAVQGDMYTMSAFWSAGSLGVTQPGLGEVQRLLNVGMTMGGDAIPLEARLAEAVPTTENGLWQVLSDGRMTTTWKLRPGVLWHDGTPVTSEDFLFNYQVATDRELDVARAAILGFIEKVEAPDPRTVIATWKSTYIDADKMFNGGAHAAMPRHLLQDTYENNKRAFATLPYWNREFVGTGPYKLKEYEQGSHAIFTINENYVLGRPKIDEIEARSILEPRTLVANLLSREVDVTFSRQISIEQANAVRDTWTDGKFDIEYGAGSTHLGPQHVAERQKPSLIGNVKFRQALYHALDRQQMVDSIAGGLTQVSHSGLPADDPTFASLHSRAVRYDYDPRKAQQLLDELGVKKLPGGGMADATGKRLEPIEVVSSTTEIYTKTALAAAGLWAAFGLETIPATVPEARESDLEYRAMFPGFEAVGTGSPYTNYVQLRESNVRTRANGFRGSNRTGYFHPDLDPLLDRYLVTIPLAERLQILGDIVQHVTSNVVLLYLMYSSQPVAVSNRLVNVNAAQTTLNVLDWDVKS